MGHIINRGNIKVYENQNAAPVSAVMFGDSFHLALVPYLSESFRRLVFVHRSDFDHELIDRENPDIVILESADRFLAKLAPDHAKLPTSEIILDKLRKFSDGELMGALSTAQKWADQSPSTAEAYLHLGLVLFILNRFEESAASFNRADSIAGDWPLARRYASISLYESGLYSQSRALFSESRLEHSDELLISPISTSAARAHDAINIEPDWGLPHHHLAKILYGAKDFVSAETHQLRAINLLTESAIAHHRLGLTFYAQGQLTKAEDALRDSIRINNNFKPAWLSIAQIRLKAHRFEEAEEAFQQVVRLEPHMVEHHFHLGLARLRAGHLHTAITSFSNAISLDPGHDSSHVQKGVAYKKLGNVKDAEIEFSKALKINPKNRGARYELSHILADSGRVKDASQILQNAIEHNPNDIEINLLMAQIHTRLKQYQEAINIIDAVLLKHPAHTHASNQKATVQRLLLGAR